MEPKAYVEFRGGGWYFIGSRVSLDSIVYVHREGLSPEIIVSECYPALSLEQVYGGIAFYLANQEEIDRYLIEWEKREELLRAQAPSLPPALAERLAEAKRQLDIKKAATSAE